MSARGKRSLMQVEPARLVELAAASERILADMRQDWASAQGDLSSACGSLGDAAGTANLSASYADALGDADGVLTSLAAALELGVAGLVDAAGDATRADDTVAAELERATHLVDEGPSVVLPGQGGR